MEMSSKRKGLGKGLSALLEDSNVSNNRERPAAADSGIAEVEISKIEANPFNPRTKFEKEALDELASSIKTHGVIQPITVRKVGNKYQIISGERRFRASILVGNTHIPAYVREANDQKVLEMALVENIQRENLDAIEVAVSYKRLMDECDLTQEELSKKIGKSRSSVTNFIRLLKLPAEVQIAVRDKELSMGHARALAGVEKEADAIKLLKSCLKNGWSVRQLEAATKKIAEPKQETKETNDVSLSFEHQKVKGDLESYLGTKIAIKKGSNGNGKIVINFGDEADFKRIIDLLDF